MAANSECKRIELLEIARIRVDGNTQGRIHVDEAVTFEYAELMKANVEFPPVRVWFDGEYYWLSDGFQRLEAAKSIGKRQAAAEVLFGTLEDAKWDSYSANGSHGVRRSAADLHEIIRRCIAHPRAAQLSNNQIARHLSVPEATLRRWRQRVSSSPGEDTVRIAVRGNVSYPIKTENIGKGHRRNDRCAKSLRMLEQELDEMKCSASPHTRRFLNIFGNWLRTKADISTTLAAIEGMVSELTERRSGLQETASGSSNGGRGHAAGKTARSLPPTLIAIEGKKFEH